jgi:hypothetical protein
VIGMALRIAVDELPLRSPIGTRASGILSVILSNESHMSTDESRDRPRLLGLFISTVDYKS